METEEESDVEVWEEVAVLLLEYLGIGTGFLVGPGTLAGTGSPVGVGSRSG